ncbi:MAG: hypothetical protein EPO45_01625 [Sphingobium sp.]|nr:MAG: hypothetical protein EPO45_01625 [Sphingobium sp.]
MPFNAERPPPITHRVNVEHAAATLAYEGMMKLAQTFHHWAFHEEALDDDQRTTLVQLSADYERIAEFCGPGWSPPPSENDEEDLLSHIASLLQSNAQRSPSTYEEARQKVAILSFPIPKGSFDDALAVLDAWMTTADADDISSDLPKARHMLAILPQPTPDEYLALTFSVQDYYFHQWVALELTETTLTCSVGEHVYDPGVGGDSTSEIVFECNRDGWSRGDFWDWDRRLSKLDPKALSVQVEGLS